MAFRPVHDPYRSGHSPGERADEAFSKQHGRGVSSHSSRRISIPLLLPNKRLQRLRCSQRYSVIGNRRSSTKPLSRRESCRCPPGSGPACVPRARRSLLSLPSVCERGALASATVSGSGPPRRRTVASRDASRLHVHVGWYHGPGSLSAAKVCSRHHAVLRLLRRARVDRQSASCTPRHRLGRTACDRLRMSCRASVGPVRRGYHPGTPRARALAGGFSGSAARSTSTRPLPCLKDVSGVTVPSCLAGPYAATTGGCAISASRRTSACSEALERSHRGWANVIPRFRTGRDQTGPVSPGGSTQFKSSEFVDRLFEK